MSVNIKTERLLLDHFILTFRYNTLPVVVIERAGKMIPAKWLTDISNAEYVGRNGESIEIAIPIGRFLQIKDSPEFQCQCRNLIRLRTTPRTVLSTLCYPINHIDNKLDFLIETKTNS